MELVMYVDEDISTMAGNADYGIPPKSAKEILRKYWRRVKWRNFGQEAEANRFINGGQTVTLEAVQLRKQQKVTFTIHTAE